MYSYPPSLAAIWHAVTTQKTVDLVTPTTHNQHDQDLHVASGVAYQSGSPEGLKAGKKCEVL